MVLTMQEVEEEADLVVLAPYTSARRVSLDWVLTLKGKMQLMERDSSMKRLQKDLGECDDGSRELIRIWSEEVHRWV